MGGIVPDVDIFEHVRIAMCEYGILHTGTNFKCQPQCFSNSISRSYQVHKHKFKLNYFYSLKGQELWQCVSSEWKQLQCQVRGSWEIGEADCFHLRYSRKKSSKHIARILLTEFQWALDGAMSSLCWY